MTQKRLTRGGCHSMFFMDLPGLQPLNSFGQGERKSWEAERKENLFQSKFTADWEEGKTFKIKENNRRIREGFPELSSLWNSSTRHVPISHVVASLPLHGLSSWFSVMQHLSPNGVVNKQKVFFSVMQHLFPRWSGSERNSSRLTMWKLVSVVGGTAQMWWDAHLGGGRIFTVRAKQSLS